MLNTVMLAVSGALLATTTLPALAGQGQSARTWISAGGADQAGCGAVVSPCRSLQFAHDNTAAGGEIDIKDPAGYGSVVITKAISIVNDGVGVAGVLAPAGQDAIQINAGASDTVTLRGLTIEGAGVGANGVDFKAGGGLILTNSTLQGFAGADNQHGNGVLIQHSSGSPLINIADIRVLNNGYLGVSYIPTGTGGGSINVDRLTAIKNKIGFAYYTKGADTTPTGSLTNSVTNDNSSMGVQLIGRGAFIMNADVSTNYAANNSNQLDFYFASSIVVALSGCTGGSLTVDGGVVATFKNNAIQAAYVKSGSVITIGQY